MTYENKLLYSIITSFLWNSISIYHNIFIMSSEFKRH
nr:MAG TPA: hypothetical protein [Caudoviricetes sp.]